MTPAPSQSTAHLIIGFSPGSASDTLANIIAPELERVLDRSVEIERIPGKDGVIAARALAARPPDGNHLMIATLGTHALTPSIVPNSYDPTGDFTPVAALARAPLILGVAKNLGVATLAEFADFVRSSGRPVMFACSAAIGAPRLAAALFRERSGLDVRTLIYEQTRTLYDDLVAGRIDASFNNPMTMLPLQESGKITALAATGRTRCQAAPSIPTMLELGLADFVVENWLGVVAPAGLARDDVDRLNKAIRAALGVDGIRRAFDEQGMTMPSESADEFSDYIRQEVRRWATLAQGLTKN